MSLLDDARRIESEGGGRYDGDTETWDCPYCPGRFDHTPDCPWLSMPRIVAALEAAERLIKEDPAESDYSSNPGGCQFCDGKTTGGLTTLHLAHVGGCPWAALEDAITADVAQGLTGTT